MPAIPSPRAALVATVVSGVLAAMAALIVWQTRRPPAAEGALDDATAREPTALPPKDSAERTTADGHVTLPTGAPITLDASSPDDERLFAAEVRSLVAAGKIGKARTLANAYYERFPDGPATAELGRLTGAHPRRDATGTRP